MEYSLLSFLGLINLAMVATHAALPPEIYWKSILPTTPIPKAITDILHNEPNGKNVYVGEGGNGPNLLRCYGSAATEHELHDDPVLALFFLEKDLHPGSKLQMQFTKTSNDAATFLPRKVADSIPFSSSKVEDIFKVFSVKPGSEEGVVIKNAINQCEDYGVNGEERYCATSLESMVDYITSKLGKNVNAVSTEANNETKLQTYTITQGVKKITGVNAVVCHKLNYPYAVFYCHKHESSPRAYTVPLEGADGIRVKAVAVCHTDTSKWNPKNAALQVLNVKPGTVPVCHFLPEDHVVWAPKA